MQNPQDLFGNMGNLSNLDEFYKKMGFFDTKTTNFNQRMNEIAKKMGKK